MSMLPVSGTSRSHRIALDLPYVLFTLAYLVMIFWLSTHTEAMTSGRGPLAQLASTLYHVPLYAGFGFFILQAISRRQALAAYPWSRVTFTFAAAAVVAMLDEWRQFHIPGRDPAAFDVLLDLAGVAGLLLVCALGSTQKQRS